jgi:hypothetical protein
MQIVDGNWLGVKDGDVAARDIFRRHYTWHEYKDGRAHNIFVGPGEKMVLVTQNWNALFIWRKFIDNSGQVGVNCVVFRNESNILASSLILEAEQLAWGRWPGERLYTYVNPVSIQHKRQPGRCFLKAGWNYLKDDHHRNILTAVNKLLILEKLPD